MKLVPRLWRTRWRASIRFWALAIVLSFIAALAVLGIKFMFDSVGASKHTRYEPVDVPPTNVSPAHERERLERERRGRAGGEKTE
ncbi:MAG: hypothetical protein ACREIS_07720 [Nitrospiraceae bacterium]